MNQSEIVLSLLFKANRQLTEAVEKRMGDFDHPASGLKVRIMRSFFALLASGADMGRVPALLNGLGTACITGVRAEILRMVLTAGRTGKDDVIRCFFREPAVMRVCTCENNGQRKSFFIG